MSQTHRRAARTDGNQTQIVKELRRKGFTVETGHDDILVGYDAGGVKRTFWFELKQPGHEGELKPSQVALLKDWRGHYAVVSRVEQIIEAVQRQCP